MTIHESMCPAGYLKTHASSMPQAQTRPTRFTPVKGSRSPSKLGLQAPNIVLLSIWISQDLRAKKSCQASRCFIHYWSVVSTVININQCYDRGNTSSLPVCYSARSNDYVNIQLGGRASPCIQLSISFPSWLYYFWVFIYIFVRVIKRCITNKTK
jgi:hypothetical protein